MKKPSVFSNAVPAVMGERLQDYHENDLADVMPKLTVQERCKLYRILDTDMLSDIFEYTDEENAAEYLNEMDVRKAAAILSRMETDALADVLNKVEKTKKKILIDLLEPEVRRDVEMIASFDEDEIGSRMTTNYFLGTLFGALPGVSATMAVTLGQEGKNRFLQFYLAAECMPHLGFVLCAVPS